MCAGVRWWSGGGGIHPWDSIQMGGILFESAGGGFMQMYLEKGASFDILPAVFYRFELE